MRTETRAETHEPEIAGVGTWSRVAQRNLQREQDGGAAHVAMCGEDAGAAGERMGCDHWREGGEDILSAGMRDHGGDGARAAFGPELCDSTGREIRHGAVEEIAELALALLETEFVAIGGLVMRLKGKRPQAIRARLGAPDGGGRAVTEKAGTDEDAGIIIEVERGGADFHGDARDGGVGIGRKHMAGRAQGGNGRAAAETDEILEKGIGAQPEFFGDVTRDAGAEIAGAGADQERVEVGGAKTNRGQRSRECARRQGGCLGAKDGVELVGGAFENVINLWRGEVSGRDAMIAAQDAVQDETGALVQPGPDGGFFHDVPTLALGEGGGWHRGGEGVEEHVQWSKL